MSDNKDNNLHISSIVEANIARRLIAAILDFVVAIFAWFALSLLVVTPIMNSALNYQNNLLSLTEYQLNSHLYVYQQQEDNGDTLTIETNEYSEKIDSSKSNKVTSLYKSDEFKNEYYLSHLYYYYTVFLTGDLENVLYPTGKNASDYISPDYNEYVKDNILPKDYYLTSWFNKEILNIEAEDSYFISSDINVLASIKEGSDEESVKTYLREKIYEASGDLFYRSYYANKNNQVKVAQVLIIAIPYAISALTFYLIIPLCSKNGETLAKRFTHIALIDKNGYAIKKRQTVFRFFVFIAEITLSLFVVGVGLTSFATFGVGMVILLIATLLNKSHRAPHDFAAHTLVINDAKSVFFLNEEDEKARALEIEEKMARYKAKPIENKNIIQVGSTIVDEKIKQELEDNQNN